MGKPRLTLVGQRFGRLTVVATAPCKKSRTLWACRCDCGNTLTVIGHSLKRGNTQSCGCLRRERRAAVGHGLSHVPEYACWKAMRQRCMNPLAEGYEYYGGRGITVDQSWVESIAVFIRDVGQRPSPRHSLERIDNDGHYQPGNVKWALPVEQARNRRCGSFKRGPTLKCARCGTDFQIPSCRSALAKYCSRVCRDRRHQTLSHHSAAAVHSDPR